MSDATRELWCNIEGDSHPFPVSVTASDVYIDTLKEMIKQNIQVDLDAHRLNLWKPTGIISVEPSDTLGQRVRALGDLSLFAGELDPADRVANVFQLQTPTSPHLDVVVQIPVSTPQDKSTSNRPHLAVWLEEVHSKIWGRNDLEPELFRTVEVTQAHYDELQRRLKEEHPDRDSPEYDGTEHDVESIKLDVLRLIFPANSPRRPDSDEDRADNDDAPEARDDDESGMDSDQSEPSNDGGFTNGAIFPFTLRFLDLSTLGLRTCLSYRLPSPLLLRQEYDHISRLIEGKPVNRRRSVIVSGQSGTGQTAYLHLKVIQSMIQGRSFLYSGLDRIVYHINENGVRAIQSWSLDEIVAFVDGDMESYEPSFMLFDSKVQIIMASSPEGANAKWTDQAGGVKAIVTEPWSPRELFLAGVFLYPLDLSPELLKKSTLYFGYNPRRCFYSATSMQNLEETKALIESRISGIAFRQSNMVQVLHSSQMGDTSVSHSIFEISPKDELRLLSQCQFGYVSRWAFDYFLNSYESRHATEARIKGFVRENARQIGSD